MDAMTILREVADAYRDLKTLEVEAVAVTESGDEDSSQHSEQRVRFYYTSPDRMRYEAGGRRALPEVADGEHLHRVFGGPRFPGGLQYSASPIPEMDQFPHVFRPEFPIGMNYHAFLFRMIDQKVAEARILREEDGCHVLAVSYEPPPHAALILTEPAVLFWVSTANHMVLKQQGDVGIRHPTEEEINWFRNSLSVRTLKLNEPIPDETFQFTAPPEAKPMPTGGGCGFRVGGGSGFSEHRSDGRRVEHRGSHEWEGETLIERSKWKIRGMTLTFERRLDFSNDEKELRIGERYVGPAGEKETTCVLPLDKPPASSD